MSVRRQSLGRAVAVGGGAGLLVVAVTAAGAQAAATTAPHLSTAVVAAALFSSYGMPTGVKLLGKVTAIKTVVDLPCGSTAQQSKPDRCPLHRRRLLHGQDVEGVGR